MCVSVAHLVLTTPAPAFDPLTARSSSVLRRWRVALIPDVLRGSFVGKGLETVVMHYQGLDLNMGS